MYALMIYSLKVGACLAVFYLFFKLLLSRETFHRLNRVVVLAAMVLSFVLPLCVITVYRELPVLPELPGVEEAVYDVPSESQSAPFPWDMAAAVAFLAGAAATLLWTLGSVCGVLRMIRRGRRERLADGPVLVRTDQPVTPFSWCRYIVLSEKDLAENGEAIMLHEKAHLRLRHSVDLLVTDIAGCLQWFNPAMWLLRRELRAIHEYEADEAVLDSGVDAKQYQLLLIRKAAGGRWYSVANSFNHSKLKNRITMMLRKRSSRWTGARVLFLLPLTGLALGAFARTAYVFPEDKGKKENVSIRIEGAKFYSSDGTAGNPLIVIDGIEARTLDSLPPERIASFSVLKDASAEALYGERGKDGVIIVTTKDGVDAPGQGIYHGTYKAANDGDPEEVVVVGAGKMSDVKVIGYSTREKKSTLDGKNVIWIIDGKETPVKSIRELDADRIASISVLKNAEVEARYPGKHLDGVIEITSKQAAGKGKRSGHTRVTVTNSGNLEASRTAVAATEAGLKAAEAGISAARAGLETAREYMSGDEWKKAQAELDRAQKELASARKLSDAELAAVRGQQEIIREYMASDEWKEAQKKLASVRKLSAADVSAPDAKKSEDWHATTGEGIARVDHSETRSGKTTIKGHVTLHNTAEIPDSYLIFINGKKASKADVSRIASRKIKRMEILRGKEQCKEYGADVNGVVKITTRR